MIYDLRVVTWQDLLHLDADGHFDVAATRKCLGDVMWACSRSKIGRVLLDVRDATANLSSIQLVGVAMVASEVTPPDEIHKIALLTRPETQFDNAQFVAAQAQGEGWNIAAFQVFEDAVVWLSLKTAMPWTPQTGDKSNNFGHNGTGPNPEP